MTALINGTYTISSFVGNDSFYLHFRDSASGSPLRGRNYTGSSSHHWEISTGRLPNLYSVRNTLYQMQVTFPGPAEEGKIMESGNAPQDWYIIPAEGGYVVALDPGRSLVWNIAGGDPVDYAHIIFYQYSDLADNEKWHINPVELAPTSEPSESSPPVSSVTASGTPNSSPRPPTPSTSPDESSSSTSSGVVRGVSGSLPGSTLSPQSSAPSEANDDTGSAMLRLGGSRKILGALGATVVLPLLLSVL
ncbi:hypothetical protein BKA70DRAFT_1560368 [Coprinopsis sp. MPI-PUGE-AT-0042]|nr:hypothetical protein BKA70DRAFT_1560368 [Coprinopsis sp. MPI-PUGE-AT-0042]